MLPRLRDTALRLLERTRLLRPAYRAYEAVRARRTSGGAEDAPDGLPLPPAPLRTLVAGTADAAWFLDTGRRSADVVAAAAARHGVPLDAAGTP